MRADSVFCKTDLGKAAILDRSVPLSPKQRQLLIMIDGKRRIKDIFPSIDETAIARLKALAVEGLISGDQLDVVKTEAKIAAPANAPSLQVTRLPNSSALARIRGILSMCSQQFLSDELDTMLTDVFDHLNEPSELQFCLDQWLKRMRTRTPESATNLYIKQVAGLL